MTCVSKEAAQKVGLKVIAKRSIQSATQRAEVNVYLADFHFPFGNMIYAQMGIQVLEFDKGQSEYDILLGRDIISRGVLYVNFIGVSYFTFCL
jgi:hypothetical protein